MPKALELYFRLAQKLSKAIQVDVLLKYVLKIGQAGGESGILGFWLIFSQLLRLRPLGNGAPVPPPVKIRFALPVSHTPATTLTRPNRRSLPVPDPDIPEAGLTNRGRERTSRTGDRLDLRILNKRSPDKSCCEGQRIMKTRGFSKLGSC